METSKNKRVKYSRNIVEKFCYRIATGGTPTTICDESGMPTMKLFFSWLDRYPYFKDKYEEARKLQADFFADEMVELKNLAKMHPEKATAYRVAADILRWQAGVRQPRKYGDKVEISTPQKVDPDKIKSEIERLSIELGIKKIIELKPDGE